MDLIYKVLLAIVIVVVIGVYLRPLLIGFFPPFGVIILIVLFVAVIAWLMGKF